MKKSLARTIVLGLLCASVVPGVANAAKDYDVSIDGNVYTISTADKYGSITPDNGLFDKEMQTIVQDSDIILKGQNGQFQATIQQVDGGGINRTGGTAGAITFKGDELVLQGLGNNGGFLAIHNDGILNFENKVSIMSNGPGSVKNVGTINFKNDFFIQISGAQGLPIDNIGGGTININGDNCVISVAQDATTFGDAIHNSGTLNLNAAKTMIMGDIYHNVDGYGMAATNITLKNGSMFTGNIYGSNEKFHMKMESGSAWMMEGENDGWIYGLDFQGGSIYPYGNINDPYKTIKFANLKFSSNMPEHEGFYLRSDLANNVGDKISLVGPMDEVPGNIRINLLEAQAGGGIPIKPEDNHSVTLAETYTATSVDVRASYYGSDNRVYKPVIKQVLHEGEAQWQEWNFVGWSSDENPLGGDGEITLPREITPPHSIDPHILIEDLDGQLKRLNDIRTDPSEVGVWIRGEKGDTQIHNYKYEYNLMSGGYDWIRENDARKLFYGMGITYSTNDCDDSVVGDTKSLGYNIYGSWLGKKNNDYVDVVIKYGKLDKDYAGFDNNNVFVKGEYDKNLFAVAAKYGRRIFLKDSFYYEPQIGYTYGHVGSANFVDNQNTHIHADSTTSHIASLGVQVGKNIKGTEIYGKVAYVYDFDGQIRVSAPGITAEDDMGGGYMQVAIGAARRVDSNNSFYIDLGKDFGNKVKKPYSFSVGYRHTF